MFKSRSKPIKIGGRALQIVQKLSADSFKTLKHTAEFLIELGHIRMMDFKELEMALKEEINKFKREREK